MTTLIIPDIHTKWVQAQAIIDKVPHDRLVMIGDFFDDWDDTPESNRATAEWLVEKLASPNCTALWGNHDLSYYDVDRYGCSGWTKAKSLAIWPIMAEHWSKLRLHVWVDDWLLTHAGVDNRTLDPAGGRSLRENIDFHGESTMKYLFTTLPTSTSHLLIAGKSRGGEALVGGWTWCDWNELQPPAGVKQICGHTQNRQVRRKEYDESAVVICLDTRLRHCATITDGQVEVREV